MIVERCVNCMEDIGNSPGKVCPYCGYDNAGEGNGQHPYAMKHNTILHGRYLIGKVLGQGGFGITYIGFDLVLNIKIAVKEYFPMGIATRESGSSNTLLWNSTQMNTEQRQSGYENFLKEARKTAKIDRISSIVRVRDTFFENETAYIIMDYIDGVTLKSRLLKEGVMPISECIRLLTPMMEDLSQVHKMGIIHRDISPDNIMIQSDGSIKLLDLGAAKDMQSGQGQQSQLVTKKGFSPLEQYAEAGSIGPWTDVYALCATIYYCITGKTIPSAIDRINNADISFPAGLKEPLSDSVRETLKAGLSVEAEGRIRSVDILLKCLRNDSAETVTPTVSPTAAPTATETAAPTVSGTAAPTVTETASSAVPQTKASARKSKKAPIIAGAAVLVVVLIAVIVFGGGRKEKAMDVVVEKQGTSNANLSYGSWSAEFDGEYQYFVDSHQYFVDEHKEYDAGLYVCTYNQEDSTFNINDAEEVYDGYAFDITLSDDKVYFWNNGIYRMNKDGSDMVKIYDTEAAGWRLQYVRFSDSREYLYFALGGGIYRYDLETEKVKKVIRRKEGYWYNFYRDAIYYTVQTKKGIKLMKAGLDGENPEELYLLPETFSPAFIAEDAIYFHCALYNESLEQWRHWWEVYDFDGTQKDGFEGFYNLAIDSSPYTSLSYGDGWIYYAGADGNLHRARVNGAEDTVLLEGHKAESICCTDSGIWFMESVPTENGDIEKRFYLSKDGSRLVPLKDMKSAADVVEEEKNVKLAADVVEEEVEEDVLTVEKQGTSSVNLFNDGYSAEFDDEYYYFSGLGYNNNALYVCAYNEADSTFYANDAEKVYDWDVRYITLSDDKVYFWDDSFDGIYRMNKDGSDIVEIYSDIHAREIMYLQYVRFSDSREYLYFIKDDDYHELLRYDLKTEEVETVIEGECRWYNFYRDAIYYIDTKADKWKLMKADLDGENPEELNSDINCIEGFIVEDALYLYSYIDDGWLVYDFDGTQKDGFEEFYNLAIHPIHCSFGYGDGWIYYTDVDENLHRARANGAEDTVLLEECTADVICYTDSWIWIYGTLRGQEQAFCVAKDGSRLVSLYE